MSFFFFFFFWGGGGVNSRCLVQVYEARKLDSFPPEDYKIFISASHSRPTLRRQTMVFCFCYEFPLFLNIFSSEVKKRNEYVILGGIGGGVESCSIER